jgi:hypothetical protein
VRTPVGLGVGFIAGLVPPTAVAFTPITVIAAPLPPDSNPLTPEVDLTDISGWAPELCAAVCDYLDSDSTGAGLLLMSTDDRTQSTAPLLAGDDAPGSCPGVAGCVAVGTLSTGGADEVPGAIGDGPCEGHMSRGRSTWCEPDRCLSVMP